MMTRSEKMLLFFSLLFLVWFVGHQLDKKYHLFPKPPKQECESLTDLMYDSILIYPIVGQNIGQKRVIFKEGEIIVFHTFPTGWFITDLEGHKKLVLHLIRRPDEK